MEGGPPPVVPIARDARAEWFDRGRGRAWVTILGMGAAATFLGVVVLWIWAKWGFEVWGSYGRNEPPFPWRTIGWVALIGVLPAAGAARAFGRLGVTSRMRRLGLGFLVAAAGLILPYGLFAVMVIGNDIAEWFAWN